MEGESRCMGAAADARAHVAVRRHLVARQGGGGAPPLGHVAPRGVGPAERLRGTRGHPCLLARFFLCSVAPARATPLGAHDRGVLLPGLARP